MGRKEQSRIRLIGLSIIAVIVVICFAALITERRASGQQQTTGVQQPTPLSTRNGQEHPLPRVPPTISLSAQASEDRAQAHSALLSKKYGVSTREGNNGPQQGTDTPFSPSTLEHQSHAADFRSDLPTKVNEYSRAVAATTVAGIAPVNYGGLVINATFDSSISDNAGSAEIQSTINQAIGIYQFFYADRATVNILFRYSPNAPSGNPLPAGTLAQSSFVSYTIPWNSFINALKADAKSDNDNTANNSLPSSALSTNIKPSSANGRAIGLNTPGVICADGSISDACSFDGIVTINSSQPFQFSRPVSPGNYDAQQSIEHEMDEVLGLGSFLNTSGGDLRPQDLFSWSSSGMRNLTSSGPRYFSIDGGTTNIVGFNQNSNGDFGDWLSASCPQANSYVQNAFGCKGQSSDVTFHSPEGVNLDVIGYDLSLPEPAGYVDVVDCSHISGWAEYMTRPNSAVTVDIYDVHGSITDVYYSVVANQPRSDVGNHGFNFSFPSPLTQGGHQITVKISGTDFELTNNASSFTCSVTTGNSSVTMPSGWYWPTGSSFDHVNFCNYLGWLGYNSKTYPWHLAQDMCNGNSPGNSVYSIGDGDVILSRTDVGGYGPGYSKGGALVVRYQAGDGTYFTALYGHLDNPHPVGHVSAGDIIGYSNAWNPPHVHFAIHPGFDPEPNNPWRGYTDSRSNTYGFTDPLPFLNAHPRSNTGTSQPFEGYHDGTTCDKIFGWARDKTHPTNRVNVEIFDGTTKLATVPANEFRSDLLAQGIGDGNYAFNFVTPSSLKDGRDHTITIRVENSTFQLVNTGQQFNSTCSSAPTASFAMSGGGKISSNGQTLNLSVSQGSLASVDFDSSNSQPGAGTINARQWKIDGANVSTLPRFTYSLGAGTHSVSLDVMNSGGLHDTATGTVVVTESSSQAPSIGSINPTSMSPSTFDLTINGTNFDANAIDQIYFGSNFVGNGQILSRTGSTQIVVREFMSTATLGTYTVKVRNSDGQLSNGKPLTLAQSQTPAPTLNSINPSSIAPSAFDLTINGINFDNSAIDQIYFGSTLVGNGQILNRTGSTQIVVRESMSTATPGAYTVKVKNSDGQLSNGLPLTLTQPQTVAPTVNSISPNPVPVFNANQNVQVNGSNFQSGLTVDVFNGSGTKVGTLSGSGQIQNVTPTSFTMVIFLGSTAGTFGIEVVNPNGGRSSRFTFTY